jgi:hypothetical protein
VVGSDAPAFHRVPWLSEKFDFAWKDVFCKFKKRKPLGGSGRVLARPQVTTGTAQASKMVTLSTRGMVAIKPGRDDLEQFLTGLSDPYHPTANKDGYLVLLVAENKQNIDQMKQKLESIFRRESIPNWIFGYGDIRGEDKFREVVSRMMEETFIKAPVDKNCIVAQASCWLWPLPRV